MRYPDTIQVLLERYWKLYQHVELFCDYSESVANRPSEVLSVRQYGIRTVRHPCEAFTAPTMIKFRPIRPLLLALLAASLIQIDAHLWWIEAKYPLQVIQTQSAHFKISVCV